MTRFHFNKLAKIIRQIKDDTDRERAGYQMAELCAASNSKFDRNKFLKACGV